MQSRVLKLSLILFGLAVLLVPSYYFAKELQNLNKFKTFIHNYAQKRLNGKLDFGEIRWAFRDGHLGFKTKYIRLSDKDSEQFFDAGRSVVLFKWDSLLRGFNRLHKIQSKRVEIQLNKKQSGQWNFEDLIKTTGKKTKFAIDELSIDHTKLHIFDESSQKRLDYDDLLFNWQVKRFSKNYQVEIQSHQDSKKDQSSKFKGASLGAPKRKDLKNYFKIKGLIPMSNLDTWTRSRTKFNFDIVNLNLDDFDFILDDFEASKNLSGLITSQGTIKRKISRNLEAQGTLEAEGFNWTWDKLSFETLSLAHGHIIFDSVIGEKDIDFGKLVLNIEQFAIDVSGKLFAWKSKEPKLDLAIKTNQFSIKEALNSLPKSLLTEDLEEKFASIYDGLLNLDLKLKKSIFSPEVSGNLRLENFSFLAVDGASQAVKDINADLEIKQNRVYVNKFALPVAHTNLVIDGWFHGLEDTYDLKLNTTDLSLTKFRQLISNIKLSDKQRQFVSSFDISGFVNLDLRLVKLNEAEDLKILGKAKLGKVDFLSKDPAWFLRNIFADIKFGKDMISIDQLKGYFQGDYFETKGSISYDKEPDLDLKFAAAKINLGNLVRSELLHLLGIDFRPKYIAGELKDVFMKLSGKLSQDDLQYQGKVILDHVAFQKNDFSPVISSASGQLDFDQDHFKTESLALYYNNAPFVLIGSAHKTDSEERKYDFNLDIKAEDFAFNDLYYFLDEYTELHNNEAFKSIHYLSGGFDCDLSVKGQEINAKINLDNAGFYYPRLTHRFTGLTGDVLVDNEKIDFSNLSMNWGKSDFLLSGNLTNYQKYTLQDLSWDLKLEANLATEQIREDMSAKFQKFFSFKGNLPVTASITGKQSRTYVDLVADATNLAHFGFSNWLVKKNPADMTVEIKSKFNVTPKSIISDRSVIKFIQGEDKAKVKSFFHVKDMGTDDYTFYLDFQTKNKEAKLKLLEPHISILEPFKIDPGLGNFKCDTFANKIESQTICKIHADTGVVNDYGIGDLNVNNLDLDLLALTKRPVKTFFTVESGDWNTIPYTDLEFDMASTNETITVNDLKIGVLEGEAWANFELDIETLESKFDISGYDLPAHEVSEGMWAIGTEVPEGLVDGSMSGTTQGLDLEPMFFNLDAVANLVIKDGKLSQLTTMQKYLTAINTLEQGIFGFDLNNLMQTLITYEGGQFKYLVGSLDYDHGKLSFDKLLMKAEQMELELNGNIDYAKDMLDVNGRGLIPKKSKSILQKVGIGKLNIGDAITAFGGTKAAKEKRFFDFKIFGKVSDETEAVNSLRESFRWLEE